MTILRHRTLRRPHRLLYWLIALILATLSATAGDREEIAALVDEGRHRQALERLEAYLDAYPEDLEARFLKGIALAEIGDQEAAIAVFTRLADENPEIADFHNNLAVLHASRGDYEAARVALAAAVEADPESFRFRENLGDLYATLAAEAYGRSAELGEESGRTEAKRRRIEELLADPDPRGETSAAGEPAAPDEDSPCAGAIATLDGWAAAWASQDVEGYLGHYGPAFTPADDQSRESWEAERRRRLAEPGFIEILVADPVVEVCVERRARLSFTQTYCSSSFGDRIQKELWMSRTGNRWQIVSERVLESGPGELTPPTSAKPRPSAASASAATRPYRVQLGSRRERPQAEQDLERFREAHPAILGRQPARVERVDLDARGVWYRIQFGEFRDRPAAESLCRQLKERGQDCLIVGGGRPGR